MNSQNIFQSPSADIPEIERLKAEILLLKAEVQHLKLSQSDQKTKSDNKNAENEALIAQNQELHRELQTAKAANDALVPMQEQYEARCFAIQMFRLFLNTLQLSQEILEKLFPDDPTVRASAFGSTIRKIFEFMTQPLLPSIFFDSGDSINIKLHTGIDQFMEFSKAFTKFIYSSKMKLPGCDFFVCSINEPRKVQRIFSSDGSTVYEFVKFVVSFYCWNTRKIYKIVFSCDHGRTFPEEDFDVNSLVFDAIRGFSSLVNGSSVPVLKIIMGIMNRRAQWTRLPNAHFSGILRVLELRKTYVLHGCPFITSTDFCPFSQDTSNYALKFSDCRCSTNLSVSIGMLCDFLKRNTDSPLRCPFCKEILPNLVHESDCDPASFSFDLSCIEATNVLKQNRLKRLQEKGRSFPKIFGLDKKPSSELDEIKENLLSSVKVCYPRSHLPDLQGLSKESVQLFFHSNPGEDSDPEPEPESDDDQSDLEDQEDWEYWQDWVESEAHADQSDD
jgi:hypothetical protein